MRKWIVLLFAGLLALTGCDGGQTPEPTATKGAATASGYAREKVVGEANIEPARWSQLRFEVSGVVADVLVEPGDSVEARDALVQIDSIDAEQAIQEAQSALAAAEAELALALAMPRAEEIAEAEANLEDVEGALARAVAQRDQLTGGATEADIAAAQAEVTAREAEWLQAREARDDVHEQSDDEKEKENADYRLYAAREALAAAQAKLETQQNITDDRIREAEACVWAAAAQRKVAQANLDLLKAGSASWEIALAEAGVQQAEVELAAAEVALARTTLRAPFAGDVTKVNVEIGDTVALGESVIVVGTLDQLQARTVDLMELDVAQVKKGQPVTVKVDAMPEQTFAGIVNEIALRPGDYRGDVVYAVTVDLTDVDDAPLYWGMTALVEIKTD